MNREEGELRPTFLDCFGLFVRVTRVKDANVRFEIIKNRMKYEECPQRFIEKYEHANKKLREKIEESREMLPCIELSDEHRQKIVKICLEANVEGHRTDIVMRETSRALAAWNGRVEVDSVDIDEAAAIVLPHRLKQPRQSQRELEDTQDERGAEKVLDSERHKSGHRRGAGFWRERDG
ncbi:MAG: hypothetical protein LBF80_06315 [Spirochaetaceae bacterium]|jgi:Mg-chelatase subunit ChlI|nr:hypothetical protein [Spirochaetaceae bacterium]